MSLCYGVLAAAGRQPASTSIRPAATTVAAEPHSSPRSPGRCSPAGLT